MEPARFALKAAAALAAIVLQTPHAPVRAQAQPPSALTGHVTSAEEGPMEGVVITARKGGSTISISVVSDAHGRFAFPAERLQSGHYTLKARAAGYELDGARSAAEIGRAHV